MNEDWYNYGSDPYGERNEKSTGEAIAPPPTVSRSRKKERRGMSAGGVIILCLVCALLASFVGSGFTYLSMRRGGRSLLSDVLEVVAPTPVPEITVVSSGNTGAVNDTAAAIYELAKQQVVGVRTDITYYNIFGQSTAASVSGSGIIITEDGYILTNHHVVEDAIEGGLNVTVMLYDESAYAADIVGYDEENDLALLKIDAYGLNAAELGSSEDLTVGQIIYAVGNPLGELSYSMTAGIVSATDRTITTESDVAMSVFQFDAAVNEGNSGGPVYNSLGQVVGVVSAKYSSTGVEGLGFAIPVSDAAHIANQILEYGYVKDKAYLGADTATVTSSIARQYGVVEGAYVSSVTAGGAAEKAGLQEGDIITALDGQAVTGSGELTSMIRKYRASDAAVFSVFRRGTTLELTVVFDETPRQERSPDASGRDSSRSYYYSGGIDEFFRNFLWGF